MIAPAKATKAELCHRLNVARKQLDRVLARTGAPVPKGKRYDVAEVAAWVSKTIGSDGTADELKRARVDEVRLRCTRLNLDLSERRAKLIPRALVDLFLERLNRGTRDIMFENLQQTLPPQLLGHVDSIVVIRKILEDAGNRICTHMQQGIQEWEQECAEIYEREHRSDPDD